ncbi:MAG: hypothetical protein IVW57_04325 [Ktedonobacterales bacterium]|nr:hypothetical protein [Ktedonobacterales bacterium]
MPMGRERAVLRWDIHGTLLRERLERIEATLAAPPAVPATSQERAERERLARERQDVLSRLRALGPSPRAKMG